jgi:hypothetical protein
MMTEREYIDDFRQQRKEGSRINLEDLASSVERLAKDLYNKDAHFIFELIQNAEDNDYGATTRPSLRFEVCQQKIGGETGPVLIVHNNEVGFQERDVEGICRSGKSKKGKTEGYIGEKGIGFKSVFSITECPYIFSNGFQFCLPENDEETGLKYIVPHWVADVPTWVSPYETTIILPTKNESNLRTVVDALCDIAPETILFLKKLNSIQISVCLPDDNYAVEIEKHVQPVMGAAKLVELTYQMRRGTDEETLESFGYWLTEVDFPKPEAIQSEKRAGIESRRVSVAIPLGPNVHKGKLFAYLPVWEGTGLPFLINADFLLPSSREGILEDEAWNKWLRDCIAETYVKAFLSLLNTSDLPVNTKISAYASIPLETHRPFLTPIVESIQKYLENQECVLVLPDRSLSRSSGARLCLQNFRAVLGSSDSFPRYLREDAWLVSPEIEAFSSQLKAIGVKLFLLPEVIACFQDTAWVQGHDLAWFISLFRYLSTQKKLKPTDLRDLAIVPVAYPECELPRFSCDKEQPIYFSRTETDQGALADVPDWLSELAPIAFLALDFLSLLDQQPDSEALKKWSAEMLNVREFSIENYCGDVLSRLNQNHNYWTLADDKLVEATAFLAWHAGPNLDWEGLPIILSDGRKMLLRDARKLADGRSSTGVIQAIVVPDNYNPERGWQHIWRTEADRRHFVALSQTYPSKIVRVLMQNKLILEYPSAPMVKALKLNECDEYEQFCLNSIYFTRWNSVTNWRSPSCLSPNAQIQSRTSDAIVEWLKSYDLSYAEHADVVYFYYTYYRKPFPSELLDRLKKASWLPSTQGLVSPSQAFLSKQGIKDVFGDTVPYFEGALPENTLRLLGVRSEITVENLLAQLRQQSGNAKANSDMMERIYAELAAKSRTAAQDIRTQFSNAALILVKDSHGAARWCKSGECVWEDASTVLGDDFASLSAQYSKLQDFFVEKLGVKRRVDSECYAKRWLKLQESPAADLDQRRVLVERLYREIRAVTQKPEAERPAWWSGFSNKIRVYTQSDTFELPGRVILPDDGVYREIFRDDGTAIAWRPEKDAFGDWAPFYKTWGTPLLSETVTELLEDDVEYEVLTHTRFMTEATVKMIAAWLREKQKGDYERLLKDDGFARLSSLREARTTSDIKVEFRLRDIAQPRTKAYPIFWKRSDNTLIYVDGVNRSQVAKAVAKGLLENRAYKDLAEWVELVLEARDTARLKDNDWNVPQPILDLFARIAPATNVPEASSIAAAAATITQPASEAAAPPASQPVQATSPQEPAPEHANDLVGDSKEDIRPQTSVTFLNNAVSHQGSQGGPRKPQQPHYAETRDIENAAESASDHQGQPGDNKSVESGTVTGFDYAGALRETFNRPGCTEFDDEDEFEIDDVGNATVRNPQRRRDRLAAGYRERINDEPTPDERRRVTEQNLLEGPNETVRVSLYEWYRGKCQICAETWPKQDGDPYFAAAYLVERRHARWLDDPGNAICLCAKHFAQWRHAAKEMLSDVGEQIHSLRLRAEGGDGDLSIYFTLLGEDVAIRYDERHLLALRTLLEVTEKVVATD